MNDSLAAALAMLSTTYVTNVAPQAETITVSLPSSAKVKKEKAPKTPKGKKSAPIKAAVSNSAESLPTNMPAVGSLDATAFLIACRSAGKRFVEKVNEVTGQVYIGSVLDQGLVREDTIRAIHAFVGYDPTGNFGQQDDSARRKAAGILRGDIVPAAYHRRGNANVAATIAGYTAGAPDQDSKHRANLLAQEKVSADTYIDLSKMDPNEILTVGGVRMTARIMCELEFERLRKIRADLSAL